MKHLPLTLALTSIALSACMSSTDGTSDDNSSAAMSSTDSAATSIVSWKFEETRRAEFDQPFSRVIVRFGEPLKKSVIVGEFSGTCVKQTKEEYSKEGPDVITGARCWWAGAGEDFIVRRKKPGVIRIEHRSVDEGTAEAPAPVFPYKLIGDEIQVDETLKIR